jgi:phosphoglycerate dehydrogenase-like enzyme
VLAYGASMTVVTLPDESWADEVGPIHGLEYVPWDLRSEPARAAEVAVVVPPYMGSTSVLGALSSTPNVDLVQLLTAGYESALPLLPAGVRLANAGGVHDASTAELALTLVLASLRGLPEFVAAQSEGTWVPLRIHPALADRRVLILGYGSIGRAVAARLAPFEVELTAVASRRRPGDDLVPLVHGVEELPDLLSTADVVVVVVPLNDQTERLVDDAFLAALPDGALLVNVARGKVVDTDALVRATSSGRVRAALDVTDPEPLPPKHPLWSAPGILVTPHVGGASSAFRPRAVRLLREQLSSYAAGRPLRNLVHGG